MTKGRLTRTATVVVTTSSVLLTTGVLADNTSQQEISTVAHVDQIGTMELSRSWKAEPQQDDVEPEQKSVADENIAGLGTLVAAACSALLTAALVSLAVHGRRRMLRGEL